MENKSNIKIIENEIQILYSLNHSNIIKVLDYGTDGIVIKKKSTFNNITYILLEYAERGSLYDICER